MAITCIQNEINVCRFLQGTSVETKCTIRVSVEALGGEQSTRSLQMALQGWCNKQTPQLFLENALSLSDGSAVFEISPAPGTVMSFKRPFASRHTYIHVIWVFVKFVRYENPAGPERPKTDGRERENAQNYLNW